VLGVQKLQQEISISEHLPSLGEGSRPIDMISALDSPRGVHYARKLLCLHCLCFFVHFPKEKREKKKAHKSRLWVGWRAK